jgi:hypothetical protein
MEAIRSRNIIGQHLQGVLGDSSSHRIVVIHQRDKPAVPARRWLDWTVGIAFVVMGTLAFAPY